MRWPKRNEYSVGNSNATPWTSTFENSLRHVKKPVTALNFLLSNKRIFSHFFFFFWKASRGPARKAAAACIWSGSQLGPLRFTFSSRNSYTFSFFWGRTMLACSLFSQGSRFGHWLITRNGNLLGKSNDQTRLRIKRIAKSC